MGHNIFIVSVVGSNNNKKLHSAETLNSKAKQSEPEPVSVSVYRVRLHFIYLINVAYSERGKLLFCLMKTPGSILD